MGSVYKRGSFWWIAFKLPGGSRALRSTGISSARPEAEARKVLEQIEKELTNETKRELHSKMTVAEYAIQWTASRKAAKQMNATRDFERLTLHAFPAIGAKRLGAVSVTDIRSLVSKLRGSELAARTVLNIYGLVRRLFVDAMADELISASPCVLKRRDLPKKADKDPTWRARAVFTRDEVETLLSNGTVPLDRRVTYAIAFLTGMREGEIAALRWSSIDRDTTPLSRVLVAYSFTRHNAVEKSTKTGQPREVPMHPTLERLLREWEEKGFAEYFGRTPKPDDLVVPNRHGAHRTDNSFMKGLHRDLELMGWRKRRLHDARRTFISIGRSDGANDAVLRSITHDQVGDQFDQYTTFSFETKCEAIQKLNITGRAVQMATTVAATGTATSPATIRGSTMEATGIHTAFSVGRAGLEASSRQPTKTQNEAKRSVAGSVGVSGPRLASVKRSNVATSEIGADLGEAVADFERLHDTDRLASRLRVLLAKLRTARGAR